MTSSSLLKMPGLGDTLAQSVPPHITMGDLTGEWYPNRVKFWCRQRRYLWQDWHLWC